MKILGTELQLRVWNETKKIHRVKTVTYKCIANKHKAYRTEANACVKNALSIIIPSQREIRQNGETEGYFKILSSDKKNFFLIKRVNLMCFL